MRLIVLSDFHKSFAAAKAAAEVISGDRPDAVLVAGDISHGDVEEAAKLLEVLGSAAAPVFFVPGNMDSPDLSDWSIEAVKSLHGRCLGLRGYELVGLGGSVHTPFHTPLEFSEVEVAEILNRAVTACACRSLILVSHCPPRGIKLDKTRIGIHAGSRSVRQFIESRKPILAVSGHIHEAQGIDSLGDTTVVNPGPAYAGSYAKIEVNNKVWAALSKLKM
ncbi:metallophosphoesterase family protein [Candidatus Bathyarchaeota archaeon]|nr:metallophosphoesterase family protein [Candidatus Bathyarchaeota archaeon]